jgi:imidazolonepropionase-like amidohydrolase
MLIHSATIWDGATTTTRSALHTAGERIVWVGPERDAPPPAEGDLVIDAGGRWVLPGLIDLHVHLTADPASRDLGYHRLTTSVAEGALLGARHARLMLEAGFTAARDLGAPGYASVALRRAIDAGWIPGPRLAVAGSGLTVTGGHLDFAFRPDLVLPAPDVLDGPQQVRRAVREQVKYGVDWIKLLVTGGVLTGGTALGPRLWDDDELHAALAAARRLGKPVAAHCHGADGVTAAAEAGVATVEHGTLGDADSAAAMARHHVVLVPTLSAVASIIVAAEAGRLPAAVAAQVRTIQPAFAGAFEAARDAGVTIGCGTDTPSGGTVFGANARELVHLVEHGLTPEEALTSATRTAAAVLGWSEQLGALAPGKFADFVLVDGDPLSDIACLTELARMHLVAKGGQVVMDRRPDR